MTTSHTQQPQEITWIQQAISGDDDAFGQLVEAYQRPVYNLCYRMLGDEDEAEDAAQEAFLRAYTHLHRYDPQRRFLTWILSIASNHCIDRLRRRRINWLSFDDEPYVERMVSPIEGPYSHAERTEEARQVQRWVDQLAPNYRIPLVLLYWYELSYEEIAEVLSLSVPAVKSRLHRARSQIADMIMTQQPALARHPAPAQRSPVSIVAAN